MSGEMLVERFGKYSDQDDRFPEEMEFEEFWKKYPKGFQVRKVIWWCEGNKIEMPLNEDFKSPEVLPDKTGVIFLQAPEKYAPDNAIILNADGTTRMRLKNPYPLHPGHTPGDEYSFSDCYRENDHLFVVVETCSRMEKIGRAHV